jgi:hypothetical protein
MQLRSPRYPSLYEINARVYLNSLRLEGSAGNLDDIPDTEIDELRRLGFDWIYLLGVWQTGKASRLVSRSLPELRPEYFALLEDLQEEDICGSCFAVKAYRVHADLGGNAALQRLRERLHQRGLRLMLDFVHNHTALDHPWVRQHPEFYVQGTHAQLLGQPHNYTRLQTPAGAIVFAHGRDPNFPGWTDTLQLNYGNPTLQQAMIDELAKVAALCDGVRCDMAMLALPDVFARTWGIQAEPFWPQAIQAIHARYPNFTFLAEAYWNLEWVLQQQGFDFTYDKRLYDHLRASHARPVREHFRGAADYQSKSARFLENHDEPRAASVFPLDMHRAAAVLVFLCPGLRFFHQGQLQGWQKKIPMQLCRAPEQPAQPQIEIFYGRLLELLRQDIPRNGDWQLLECAPAWEGNPSWDSFIAFAWRGVDGKHWLVVVNYAPYPGQCYLQLPFPEWGMTSLHLNDLLSPASYSREGDLLLDRGLYLDLPAWGYHVFEVVKLGNP